MHPQRVLDLLLIFDLRVLRTHRHQRQDAVLLGEFEELGLSAQGVVRAVPGAGAGVFEGEEGVGFCAGGVGPGKFGVRYGCFSGSGVGVGGAGC